MLSEEACVWHCVRHITEEDQCGWAWEQRRLDGTEPTMNTHTACVCAVVATADEEDHCGGGPRAAQAGWHGAHHEQRAGHGLEFQELGVRADAAGRCVLV